MLRLRPAENGRGLIESTSVTGGEWIESKSVFSSEISSVQIESISIPSSIQSMVLVSSFYCAYMLITKRARILCVWGSPYAFFSIFDEVRPISYAYGDKIRFPYAYGVQ